MGHKSNKILVFTSAFRPFIGGSEIAIEEIIKRLPEFFFDIITPRYDRRLPKEESGQNFRIHRTGWGSKLDKFLFPIAGFLKARSLPSPRAVQAYQLSYGGGAGWFYKIFYPKIDFIVTMQEGKELKRQGYLINFFRKLIIRKADQATAISRYLADYIFSVRKDLPVTIIPNGVDLGHFSRQFSYGELTDLENKLRIKPDDKVVISVSRLVHKNGIDLLLEAMAGLVKKVPGVNYKLILIGDGPLRKNYELLITNYGLERNVIFTGSVNIKELPIYLKISDIFVRPSRSEGLGTAFLEAMAAGIPVIGTAVGGIPDFLEDRKTGLISSGRPDDIAFKIQVLLDNDNLRNDIIERSRRLITEKYEWSIIADKFKKLYADLS